jgi:hypothetical protein
MLDWLDMMDRRLRDAIDGQLWDYIAFAVSFIALFYFGCLWAAI